MIEEVSFYKTSDGTTFNDEDDAYNYETMFALKKAKMKIYNMDMQEINMLEPHQNSFDTNVSYIIVGDASQDNVADAAEMVYSWVDSSVFRDKIHPNTAIMYDECDEEWISIDDYIQKIKDITEKLSLLKSLSEKEQHS